MKRRPTKLRLQHLYRRVIGAVLEAVAKTLRAG